MSKPNDPGIETPDQPDEDEYQPPPQSVITATAFIAVLLVSAMLVYEIVHPYWPSHVPDMMGVSLR